MFYVYALLNTEVLVMQKAAQKFNANKHKLCELIQKFFLS